MSEQWFLKVEEMSRRARQVVEDGKITFYPESWKRPYLLWLENLKDWCISRQIWWGHRIPVYYCRKEQCPPFAALQKPETCPHCGGNDIVQDDDVLDTWFSSALWPFSVFGWPDKKKTDTIPDLDYYYPTSVLVTGHEILYLWVARMVQMGLQFRNDVPFRDVFIHGIVRDRHGKKMSKSLGNVIDPLDIMAKFGTDALRFALTQSAAPGRDMQLAEDSFVGARNFANKIWNASRFVMMNAQNVRWEKEFIMAVWPLEMADQWILSEYRRTVKQVTTALQQYDMDQAARVLYDFFWSKYCDWYIEIAKIRINGQDEEAKKAVLSVLMEVLSGVLRMLHPIMPFITEEIGQSLSQFMKQRGTAKSIMLSKWPEADESKIDEAALRKMAMIQEIVTVLRTVRSEMNVPPGKNIAVVMSNVGAEQRPVINDYRHYIMSLAKLESLDAGEKLPRPKQSAAALASGMELFVPLAGLIDFEKEKKRLDKELDGARVELERCAGKMENAEFMQKAPEKEKERIRERLESARTKIERIQNSLKSLA
jgi:valyl-tRNA synthetase